jgi:hypothetical protein
MVQINAIASDRVEQAKQLRSLTSPQRDDKKIDGDKKSEAGVKTERPEKNPDVNKAKEAESKYLESKQRDTQAEQTRKSDDTDQSSRGSRLDIAV